MTESRLVVTPTAAGTRIAVRVTPRASRTAIHGVHDGRLVVRVTAPPVDRAANDAMVRLLATSLDMPRSAIRLVAGHASRNKIVEITGMNVAEVRRRLGP